MNDRPGAETSTWQHTTLTTDIHAPEEVRTRNTSKRAAWDPRLIPRGHWNRSVCYKYKHVISVLYNIRSCDDTKWITGARNVKFSL
jgi:hypothetical protein